MSKKLTAAQRVANLEELAVRNTNEITELKKRLAPVQEEFWTTREGERIAVGAMDEGHVRNALRMVLRQQRKRRQQVRASVLNNPLFRGDGGRVLRLSDGFDGEGWEWR